MYGYPYGPNRMAMLKAVIEITLLDDFV